MRSAPNRFQMLAVFSHAVLLLYPQPGEKSETSRAGRRRVVALQQIFALNHSGRASLPSFSENEPFVDHTQHSYPNAISPGSVNGVILQEISRCFSTAHDFVNQDDFCQHTKIKSLVVCTINCVKDSCRDGDGFRLFDVQRL